ncbi:MAG TPA: ATP-dependent Clp protease proteolytic subunit [Candidatus Blautia faecipullorum]|nr:ATP-dependent Clp protease proteolytic subunit [Candidatus Blautia faecipullorum]
MRMTFYTANCRGNAKNSLYPNKRVADNEDDFLEIIAFDHVCGEFKEFGRSGDNFLSCDVDVMLSEVKESIINAYVLKTGLSRARLSHLMDAETWMDANKAVELGFADDIMVRAKAEPEDAAGEETDPEKDEEETTGKPPAADTYMLFSRRAVNNALLNKLEAKYGREKPNTIQTQAKIPADDTGTGRSVDVLMERLHLLRH